MTRATSLLLLAVVISACGRPEDPARIELRALLKQDARLYDDNLGRLLDEVGRSIAGKTFRIKQGEVTQEMNEEQRAMVFGMLTNSAGMFDEGPRLEGDAAFRVLNSPGPPLSAEIEATVRLWVDVETFLPSRFEFTYAFPGFGDYSFDLVVAR